MRTASIAAALLAPLLALAALPAAAQGYYGPYNQGYGHAYQAPRYGYSHRSYGRYDFNGQADRPGDYRCDAFWDANRTDCGAAWRDQRPYRGRYANSGYYSGSYGYGGYSYGYGSYGYGRPVHYRGYGSAHGAGVYPGAYGRPDLVYPGGGHSYGPGYDHGGRDPGRIAWCRSAYRSYDPGSGYYRAYSGRLIYCG